MPQVGCQLRQLCVHVGARAIPAKQGVNRKGMPEVVDPRVVPVCGFDTALVEERLDAVGDPGAAVCAASANRIPEQRRAGGRWQFQPGADGKIRLDLFGDTLMDR